LKTNKKPNHLVNEKSPYLIQHIYNPVDWYPWGEEALERARKEDKPIFMSVGYSTCYWCHVMERESFENEAIAEILNRNFISIKVDREERPDLDKVYMSALQSMTGSGGWPMNMFLTPELKPFYGATYIPPREKYNRAGFEDVLDKIIEVWKNQREDITESSNRIFSILNNKANPVRITEDGSLKDFPLDECFDVCKTTYDYENGGFGNGNKFPRPALFNYLLQYYKKSENIEALDMVTHTLKAMAKGGINDHLAGGYHRYSVDQFWRVPHFEKMLYDQAQISNSFIDAYLITEDDFFKESAKDILGYVTKTLLSKSGGFFSAEDAESAPDEDEPDRKEEGYFYLFTKQEIDELLGKENADVFNFAFGITHEGNTIYDPHEVFKNRNVLYQAFDIWETAKQFNIDPEDADKIISDAKEKLLKIRNKRVRPGLDDKILTSWNALMISAYAYYYSVTNSKDHLKIAENACRFILEKLYDKKEKVLYHRYKDGERKYSGTLDDYAYFIDALIKLYEATFNTEYIFTAIEFADLALDKFYDSEFGGFFDVEENKADVFIRTKDIYDGAEPSGNSYMVNNLLKLARFSEQKMYEENAMKTLEFYFDDLKRFPFSHPQMLIALSNYVNPMKEIIISGKDAEDFRSEINEVFLPDKVLIKADKKLEQIMPVIKNYLSASEKETKVFICENFKCEAPISDLEKLKSKLKEY